MNIPLRPLRPKFSAGTLSPIYRHQPLPKPPPELWRLLKAAVDTSDMAMARSVEAHESAETLGLRAMNKIHALVDERQRSEKQLTQFSTQIMGLIQQVQEREASTGDLVAGLDARLDRIEKQLTILATSLHGIANQSAKGEFGGRSVQSSDTLAEVMRLQVEAQKQLSDQIATVAAAVDELRDGMTQLSPASESSAGIFTNRY